MIAIDTSSFIAFLDGSRGMDVQTVEEALKAKQGVLPPVVLAELLSDGGIAPAVLDLFRELPLLEITDGYWERAGLLRAQLLSHKRKARLADTLIAQSCLDHRVPLITRDEDFQSFKELTDLKLMG